MLYHCTPETMSCCPFSAIVSPLYHLRITLEDDQLPLKVTACCYCSERGVNRKGFVCGNSWLWETLGMLWECKGPSGWLSPHSYLHSPAGQLTGESNSKRVEEALPEGPLPRYNPSKWNQSGTMHPTVASKRSPHLLLSSVHRSVPLWRPSHLKSAVSHWQDKVSMVFLTMILIYRQTVFCLYQRSAVCFCFCFPQ